MLTVLLVISKMYYANKKSAGYRFGGISVFAGFIVDKYV